MSINPQDWLERSVTPERMTRNATKTMRILSNLIASNGGQFKGIAEYAMSNSTSQIQLPEQWQFTIDPQNKGRSLGYTKPDFDDKDWQKLRVSTSWESQGIDTPNPGTPDAKRPYDGIAWYRCRVVIPSAMKGKPLQLSLGKIDDMDVTYFNGKRIGATGKDVDSYWSVQRQYALPEKLIQWDQLNTITVKVIDEQLDGGLIDGQPVIEQRNEDHYPYITVNPIFDPYYFKRW
jgi:sialate O-acetylesterase